MNFNFSKRLDNLHASAIREILKFTTDPTVISFAAGSPATEALSAEMITDLSKKVMEKDPILALQYNITEGYTPLREKIISMMNTRYNQGKDFDRLAITSGAQQAIELTAKILLDKNDTVICENPSFLGSLNAFKSYETKFVSVDIEDDGINVEMLEKKLIQNKNVKFIYLIPNFQNPTGVTMSYEKRKKVYELACKYDTLILEDNPYGDLRFDGDDIPTIKSLDTEGRVIYCGSFSKVLAPGLRVGFALAHEKIIDKITVCKQCADVHTPMLSQLICYEFLTNNDFDAHIEKLRKIYKQKAHLMLSEIEKKFDKRIKYTVPEGGLFIWCTLPDGMNSMEFCKKCVDEKVATVPGSAFLIDESTGSSSFRMNFSTPSDEQIIKGIDIISKIQF